MTRRDDLDRFYGLLAQLREQCGGERRLAECRSRMDWPQRGVYFFFEAGELREDGATPRVVRVGTHGLRPSRSTLWKRLAQHRGSLAGGGNHRGSIFRLHVGTALMAERSETPVATWGAKPAGAGARGLERELERAVSAYIGAMPFLWLEVDDPPSTDSARGLIEAGAIGLLSNLDRPVCDPPSPDWIGRLADRSVIKESGLWNVNHVRDVGYPGFLDVMEYHIRRTGKGNT